MSKYHYNVYPIFVGRFSYVLDKAGEFYRECNGRHLVRLADARNRKELNFLLKSLPENVTYMVLRSSKEYSIWVLPSSFSTQVIEILINEGYIDLNLVSRDVGYYELPTVLDDLPYNYNYIVQRYYE